MLLGNSFLPVSRSQKSPREALWCGCSAGKHVVSHMAHQPALWWCSGTGSWPSWAWGNTHTAWGMPTPHLASPPPTKEPATDTVHLERETQTQTEEVNSHEKKRNTTEGQISSKGPLLQCLVLVWKSCTLCMCMWQRDRQRKRGWFQLWAPVFLCCLSVKPVAVVTDSF